MKMTQNTKIFDLKLKAVVALLCYGLGFVGLVLPSAAQAQQACADYTVTRYRANLEKGQTFEFDVAIDPCQFLEIEFNTAASPTYGTALEVTIYNQAGEAIGYDSWTGPGYYKYGPQYGMRGAGMYPGARRLQVSGLVS